MITLPNNLARVLNCWHCTKDGNPYLYDTLPKEVLRPVELNLWIITQNFVGNNIASVIEGDLWRKSFRYRSLVDKYIEEAYNKI